MHRRKQSLQLHGEPEVATDAETAGQEQRRPVELATQNAQTILLGDQEGDVRLRMDAFENRTGSILDHQMILTVLRAIQIKLVDGREPVGRFRVELARQSLKEFLDRPRWHGEAVYASRELVAIATRPARV